MAKTVPEAQLFQASRALRVVLANMWKRLRCRHLPVDEDGYGYARCVLCGTWVLL